MNNDLEIQKEFLRSCVKRCKLSVDYEWTTLLTSVKQHLQDENTDEKAWNELTWFANRIELSSDYGVNAFSEELKNMLTVYLKSVRTKILSFVSDTGMVNSFVNHWSTYQKLCDRISMLFPTGDNLYDFPGPSTHLMEIRQMMIEEWIREIFELVNQRLMKFLENEMNADRLGRPVDSQLVISLRNSYVSLCATSEEGDTLRLYKMHFERVYVDAMLSFNVEHCCQLEYALGTEAYVAYAHKLLPEEESRGVLYLENNSSKKVFQLCVDVLVGRFRENILLEIARLMAANETKKLKVTFQVISYDKASMESVVELMQQHFQSKGLSIIQDLKKKEDGVQLVKQLNGLLSECNCWIDDIFQRNHLFGLARDRAFKFLLNFSSAESEDNGKKPDRWVEAGLSHIFASYFDLHLKKSALTHRLSRSQVEQELDKTIQLFSYVKNVDYFTKIYKMQLIKRIALETSHNLELEISTAKRIGDTRPEEHFSHPISRIFKDIETSEILRTKYEALHPDHHKDKEFKEKWLFGNSHHWNISNGSTAVSLPRDLEKSVSEMNEFYLAQYSGRKLSCNNSLSTVKIELTSDVGTFELKVTFNQMSVLSAWDYRPGQKLTLESLQLATLLPDVLLRSVLWTLVAFPRLKEQVLSYSPSVPSAKDFDISSEFWFNDSFSLMVRGKRQLNLAAGNILQVHTTSEKEVEDILNRRRLHIKEAILKIMKTRKQMHNAALAADVIQMLRPLFEPPTAFVQGCIELLADNGLIRRDRTDSDLLELVE